MKKTSYFDRFTGFEWPTIRELEPFFLAPPGKEWSYRGGNDSWAFSVRGLDGTEDKPEIDQVKVRLSMIGVRDLGVNLLHDRWDGRVRRRYTYNSKGDLTRLHELVYSLHETGIPVGLFIPFRTAWLAIKDFIESDGGLSTRIEWIANEDLPLGIFPDPGAEPA